MKKPYSGKLSIKAWAEDDRPREKLITKGRQSLSDAELIAILIGSGNRKESAVELSKRILNHYTELNELGRLSVKDLMQFRGIGEAKAVSIVAALELGRRRKETEQAKKIRITSSRDAYDCFYADLTDLVTEEFWILLLSRNNTVIKKVNVSKGGVAGTVVDTKVIFKHAIENLASSIIICHNHPSGNLKPSEADIKLTKNLKEAGKIMGIAVLDHIIVAEGSYYSFGDEGIF
jgi:DNA repair protein RadC